MAETRTTPRGWELSSTCCHTQSTGEAHGRTIALAETAANTLAQILSLQGRAKFGTDNLAGKLLLNALAAARFTDSLKQLGQSLLDAPDWGAWLAGIETPRPAPNDLPEYALDDEIDLEPEQPCIETTARVSTFAGEKMIIQCRLQKWYQPDIGRILYEESCRLEKKYKGTVVMLVILMWPSADGPEMSGEYRGKDQKGKPVNFKYELKRAWEMPPESTLNGPGTMMLVPLSQGAKERMPELMRVLKERLAKLTPDARTVESIWTAVYWSIGMVRTLEEAHSDLGDVLPLILGTIDYKKAYGGAFRKGYTQALNEGSILALRDLILQQASKRFGEDPASLTALQGLNSYDALKAIALRVPTAASWGDLVGIS